MKKSFQFMLGFLLLFAFCSVYAQQGALSTGKAPVDNINSQIKYGTFPLASVAYANDNQTSNNISIPIPDGTPFTIIGSFSGPVFASSMCKGGDGNYYLVDVGPPTQLYLFDPVAGTCTLIGAISGIVSGQEPNGISYDPVTDTYYMVSSADLYSFDLGSMTATLVGAFSPAITGLMIDLCFDENGTCYAYEVNITAGAANAYTIDLGTAALTTLGYVGFTPNYGQGMSYDMETGTIYLAAFNYDAFAGQLRTMDKATGNTTLVYQWGDQIAPFALDTQYGPPCPVEAASNPNPPTGSEDISVNLSELSWTNGAGAVTNEVYFGDSPSNLTLVQSGTLATSWTIDPSYLPLDYFSTYYWKVVEVGDTCNSSATVWNFKTEQNPNLIFVTENFYPMDAAYWTGTTNGSTKTDTSEVRGYNTEDGWFMFDISSMPADAVVDSARFWGYVNYTYYPFWSATPLPGLNPLTATAAELEAAIVANNSSSLAYVYSNESSTFTTGWHNYLMGNSANADITDAVANGWFAMGMDSRDNSTTYYINWDGWAQANVPYLTISYHYAGGGPAYFEDFEGFTSGGQVACQDSINWTTWSNLPCDPTEDAYISSNYAYSGSNSVVIVQNNDLVKPLGGQTSGTWYASFVAYIPAGNAGYFNEMNDFYGTTQYWGVEVYFDQGGAGRVLNGSTVNFTWPEDTWFQIIVKVDLDLDQADVMMATNPNDLTTIATWQWTRGGTYPLMVDANDFFGATANDQMYFDNYSFGPNMPEIIPVELTAFTANVNNGTVVLNWSTATETNNQGFEVQRNSGSGYEVLGFVQGNGTSTQQQNYSYVDKSVTEGTYTYRLRQVDFDGTSAYSNAVEVTVELPKVYSLEQNYPNPFNPATQINFSLAADSKVTLKVFNILGQEVLTLLNGDMTAGVHNVTFNASNLPSGVYIYRMEAKGVNGKSFSAVKKMILAK